MVNAADLDTEAMEEEINNIVIQEVVKWMMTKMPFKTGALLASYINTLLMEGTINSYMPYADAVEKLVNVTWTNPSTQPQARQWAWAYAESIVGPATQYVLQRHGVAQ
jgi:hypothetical protein